MNLAESCKKKKRVFSYSKEQGAQVQSGHTKHGAMTIHEVSMRVPQYSVTGEEKHCNRKQAQMVLSYCKVKPLFDSRNSRYNNE